MSWKRNKINYSVLMFLVSFVLLVTIVSASDVAYVYKNEKKIDQNVLNAFSEMSLSVDLIMEKEIPSNLSSYRIIFIGNERFSRIKEISESNVPTVLMNKYYGKEFGLVEKGSIGQIGSTTPLNVYTDEKTVRVYELELVKRKTALSYYYVPEKSCPDSLESLATTKKMFSRTRDGSVVSYMGDVCFFGIIASDYWTAEAKELFEDCVSFAANGVESSCENDADCGTGAYVGENFCEAGDVKRTYREFTCNNPGTSQSACSSSLINKTLNSCTSGCESGACVGSSGLVHNIGFVNVTNTVGVIRLQTTDNEDVLEGVPVQCNEKYKIVVRVKNLGNYSENITFDGSLGPIEIDHGDVESLSSGSTSDRTKTVNFTLPEGAYNLTIEALLEGFVDVNPLDNMITRRIPVTCGESPAGACSSDIDCPADSLSGAYCSSEGDSYKDLVSYTCQNPGEENSVCVSNNSSQKVEDCSFGCSAGVCLPEQNGGEIHDVALINVTNAVGLIRVREDNVDVPAGMHLQCNHKYQIIIRAKNLGNFTENVTFSANLGSLDLDYSASELDPTKTADRTKTVNVTLPAGNYNIDVEAVLNGFADANPLNNFAHKQVVVEC